jgi:hypothetical protein
MTVEIIGPFKSHVVVMDGRQVPYLTATPRAGGVVGLTVDERFGLDVPVADLDRVVEFVAHCIAIASGYTAHPLPEWDGPVIRHAFPRVSELR